MESEITLDTCERKRCEKAPLEIINGNVDMGSLNQMTKNMSSLPLWPALCTFPMVGIYPCNEIFYMFLFELMKVVSKEISKMTKECAVKMRIY